MCEEFNVEAAVRASAKMSDLVHPIDLGCYA